MTNFEKNPLYELPLGNARRKYGGVHTGITIIAEYATGQSTVGTYVSFRAEQRGTIFEGVGVAFDDKTDIAGAEYRKRISGGPTVYANKILFTDDWPLGSFIESIANGDLIGMGAAHATWTIFKRLLIQEKSPWVRGLDDRWLNELMDAQAEKAAS